jgi:hypothetical protein
MAAPIVFNKHHPPILILVPVPHYTASLPCASADDITVVLEGLPRVFCKFRSGMSGGSTRGHFVGPLEFHVAYSGFCTVEGKLGVCEISGPLSLRDRGPGVMDGRWVKVGNGLCSQQIPGVLADLLHLRDREGVEIIYNFGRGLYEHSFKHDFKLYELRFWRHKVIDAANMPPSREFSLAVLDGMKNKLMVDMRVLVSLESHA